MLALGALSHHAPSTLFVPEAAKLSHLYEDPVSVCVWQRAPLWSKPPQHRGLHIIERIDVTAPSAALRSRLAAVSEPLADDIDLLSELYADLTGARVVGLRLRSLETAMCPRFHVDQNLVRLICTYEGEGTEWLDDSAVDRTRLGHLAMGQPDETSGLITDPNARHQMRPFDVGLFKGALWPGRSNRGAVHRSPKVAPHTSRLLLTLEGLE